MPRKIRTVIADDEPLARAKLRRFLAAESDVEIVAEAEDGRSAVEAIESLTPDLVFLDVQMPEQDGFSVLTDLGDRRPPCVIFVTAHDQFALKAFEFHAIEFLLKPFDQARFSKALARARELLRIPGAPDTGHVDQISKLLEDVTRQRPSMGRIAIKSGKRILFLKELEIDWVEAADNYVMVHVGKSAHTIRETLSSLESRLDNRRFLRINRSMLVNIERVRDLEPLFHGEYSVRLLDGTKLICSRSHKHRLKQFLTG